MPEPVDEEDFGGQLRIRCDYETYLQFWEFSQDYYTHEHALEEMLDAVENHPESLRHWG